MALFSRITIWVSNQVLTASALNGEFNNILNNAMASSWIGFSANVGQMQQQANPGGVGTESLAGSISDELQRLRWMFAYALGTTYWYDQTGRNLGAGNLAVQTADLGSKVVTAANIADHTITALQLSPGVITPVPQNYYQAYFPMDPSNFWIQVTNSTLLPFLPSGTLPAPFGFFNVGGFGTPTIAAGNHAGIAFTAPDTGIIEIEFSVGATVSSSGAIGMMQLRETTTSTVVAHSVLNVVSNYYQWVTMSGFFNVTASTSYNFELRGSSTAGSILVGGQFNSTGQDKALLIKMKYVK